MTQTPLRLPEPRPSSKAAASRAKQALAELDLFAAIDRGDPEGVRAALAAGASPHARERQSRWPALAHSILSAGQTCAPILLEAGSDPDATTPEGCAPAMLACARRSPQLLRLLLAAGADPNRPDNQGSTPASWAAAEDEAECLRILAGAGADLDAVRHDGWSPAMVAAYHGKLGALAELARLGADLLGAQGVEDTAESLALIAGRHDCAAFIASVREAKELAASCGRLAQETRPSPPTL